MFDWQKLALNHIPTLSHSYCIKQRNNAVGASHIVAPTPSPFLSPLPVHTVKEEGTEGTNCFLGKNLRRPPHNFFEVKHFGSSTKFGSTSQLSDPPHNFFEVKHSDPQHHFLLLILRTREGLMFFIMKLRWIPPEVTPLKHA